MGPEEVPREIGLEIGQRSLDQIAAAGGTREHQRLLRLEPQDLGRVEEQDLGAAPGADSVRRRHRRLRGRGHGLFGRRPPVEVVTDLLEQLEQPTRRAALAAEGLARPVERLGESLAAEGLQQVVERPDLEGLYGVLVVGGGEDHRGDTSDATQHVEAGPLRHLHVEEAQVGLELVDDANRLVRIRGLADDLEVVNRCQQTLELLPRRFLVVDDQTANAHRASSPGSCSRAGTRRSACAPDPPGLRRSSSVPRSP